MSKPVLYTFAGSVWAAVPELAIRELGYAPEDIEMKTVNLVKGENFDPSFLNINPNATLPTLTVNGKAYVSTTEVTKYLVQNAPSGVPETTKASFIVRIHDDDVDPNFALLLARNDRELSAKGAGLALMFIANRQAALEKHADTPAAAHHAEFYKSKKAANGGLKAIYEGNAPAAVKEGFFAQSNGHWANLRKFILGELTDVLPDSAFIDGSRPGEADFHVGAWLTRIVGTTGGKHVNDLEDELGQQVPSKLVAYWGAWIERDSWKAVYAEGLH